MEIFAVNGIVRDIARFQRDFCFYFFCYVLFEGQGIGRHV